MPASSKTSGQLLRPLPETLDSVARELADLVRLGDKLEHMIATLSARHGVCDPELMAEGQAADLLSQRLAGVAAYVAALAAATPPDAQADILPGLCQLKLAEQQRQLSGPLAGAPEVSAEPELLLFGS